MRPEVPSKQLQWFGFIVGGIFLAIALWPPTVHGAPVRQWALLVAAALVLPAIVAPSTLRHPYHVWMTAGHVLGWINSRILMTVVFYVVFTPVAVILRFRKRDLLNRRFDQLAETYRQERVPRPASHLRHQF